MGGNNLRYHGTDIYGERLRVGHCEIHPHIPFELPCPECKNEEDDRKAQYANYKEHCMKTQQDYELEMYQDYIEDIKYMDGGGI